MPPLGFKSCVSIREHKIGALSAAHLGQAKEDPAWALGLQQQIQDVAVRLREKAQVLVEVLLRERFVDAFWLGPHLLTPRMADPKMKSCSLVFEAAARPNQSHWRQINSLGAETCSSVCPNLNGVGSLDSVGSLERGGFRNHFNILGEHGLKYIPAEWKECAWSLEKVFWSACQHL